MAGVERLKKYVGNHLHLLVRAKTRADWQGFIRELAGGIAMIVTGARKGAAFSGAKTAARAGSKTADATQSARRAFWDHLVFTRIVRFGRDFCNVARYVATNLWEGFGVPVRKFLEKGFRILELSDDGGVFVHARAGPEILSALKPGQAL